MINVILALALSSTQLATGLEDCHMAGLTYNNVSNVSYPNTKLSSVDLRNEVPYENWSSMEVEAWQLRRQIRDRSIRIYEQWCDSNDFRGPYTYWKNPLKHTVLMDQLRECRQQKGVEVYRPNVLILALKKMYTPAESYATIYTSVWSLQPTKVTCK